MNRCQNVVEGDKNMYDIPKCSCGQPLMMYSEEVHKIYTPITKK